ncbi:hypothetical protein [Streptomyces sp. NPDC050538]
MTAPPHAGPVLVTTAEPDRYTEQPATLKARTPPLPLAALPLDSTDTFD